MTAPRLEVRLDQLGHNAATLVGPLARRGVAVTAVTKATLGSPEIARELLRAGVSTIGDSRARIDAGRTGPATSIAATVNACVLYVILVRRLGGEHKTQPWNSIGRSAVEDTMVAVLSLGATRTFALRPRGGGTALRIRHHHGDLLVMGGSCQRTWEHAVPKTSAPTRFQAGA